MVPIDSIISVLESIPIVDYAHPPIQVVNCADPNDSLYQNGNQWSLNKVQADSAWDITKGDSLIKIAFIEYAGIDSGHPDLNDKWVGGVSTSEENGHGIQVAGMAAAETDNSIYVASLGWKLSIIGYDADWSPNDSDAITVPWRIVDAVNAGADIINCSFYTALNYPPENFDKCPYDYQSVRSAISNAVSIGVIVVAAYGNRHEPRCQNHQIPYDTYPAWYPGVIGVAATDSLDSIDVNYNYGDSLDITAPGINVQLIDGSSGTYGSVVRSGTSYSTPMVSALCGLVLSMDDDISLKQLYNIITSTADTVGPYNYGEDGWNTRYGYGRINAYKTLNLISEAPTAPAGISISGSVGQHPTITWNTNSEADINSYKVYRKRIGQDGDYIYRATVEAPDTSYTDNGITIYIGKNSAYVYYKVKAVDIIDQLSDYSNWVRTKYHAPESKLLTNQLLPSEYELHDNHPNPFNPLTTIQYDLPEKSYVQIIIYDILGNEINTLVNGLEQPGFRQITWNGTDQNSISVSSGVYLIRFSAESIQSNATYKRNSKLMFIK